MLKLKYLFENYDLASQALNLYEHDENSFNLFKYFRISSNAVYPFKIKDQIAFLRLAPVCEKSGNEILAEINYINYLRENNYRALEPIKTINDNYLELIKMGDEKWFVTAFYKVEGLQIESILEKEEIDNIHVIKEYGKSLAKLHSISKNYSKTIIKESMFDKLSFIEQEIREAKVNNVILESFYKMKNDLYQIPITNDNYGLIHYDFEPDNVFYDKKSNQISVIDFDDSMYGFYFVDIIQAIDELDPIYHDSFLTSYHDIIPMDYQIKTYENTLRCFRNFYSLARLYHSINEFVDNQPDWLINLISKLHYKITVLEKEVSKYK